MLGYTLLIACHGSPVKMVKLELVLVMLAASLSTGFSTALAVFQDTTIYLQAAAVDKSKSTIY
jgi:hypothetical protein